MTNYTIVGSDVDEEGGTYSGNSPGQAAKKAAMALFRKTKKTHFKLLIRQKGSDKTKYYEAKIVHLKTPTVVSIKGKDIEYNFKVELQTCQKGDMKTAKSPK
jgi:hypothetical protein